ncbi:MAG TPA: DEAD/DEAH box helicase [Dissulfurispiraceae bacterium]|nr:DEAD/DEAH box helicase [Dissulfurispiraceae bacterium]
MRFEELDIPESVMAGIRAAGFIECTPVQAMMLPQALLGKDIAAQAQTGTGKTAAFLIAVFSRMIVGNKRSRGPSPRALIIAPTRELVAQINAEARILCGTTGFRVLPVFGGIDYNKQREDLARGVDVLIGTPGRLIDYLKQRVYSLKKTEFLVIDEADRMFDMGFISDLRFLLRRMSPYSERQSMLFSATLSFRVMELSHEFMNMPEKFVVTPEQMTVELVEQQIYHVGKSEKFGLLLGLIRREPEGRYLVFCNMKVTAEKIKKLLDANGIANASITGDLPQERRLKVLANFKCGKFPVLIATDVASRGLHIEGVTHVINYDLPQDPEDYVHRIGRTGRAGAGGFAISLACEDYVMSLPDIEKYIKQKIPVMTLTDEMIVTDYKKADALSRKQLTVKKNHHSSNRGNKRGRRGKHVGTFIADNSSRADSTPAATNMGGNPSRRNRRRAKKSIQNPEGTENKKSDE